MYALQWATIATLCREAGGGEPPFVLVEHVFGATNRTNTDVFAGPVAKAFAFALSGPTLTRWP